MKNTLKLLALTMAAGAVIALAGCAASRPGLFNDADPKPPTALERQLFDVITNTRPLVVTQTNVVTLTQTNAVVVWQTNEVAGAPPVVVQLTNRVIEVAYQTNTVMATNWVDGYQLAPGKGSQAAQAIGGAVAGPFGWDGVVSLILGALFSTYLGWRNRALSGTVKTSTAVAETLAQNIQTLRRVIETTPQGAQLGVLCKQYLIQHQNQAGVIQEVSAIVSDVIDEPSAKVAAEEIQRLLATVSPATPAKS